ncbi:uncharacterized protein [Halyomorpha halys]|uniref:uncharacterized protein isoform X1 n=1 Tax=Halyomorpha halys TaxID=286706 RepID=UPI0006D52113
MSVVLAGPYDSRSYVIGSYVLYVTQTKCHTFFYQLIPMKTQNWKDWLKNICKEENWNFEDLRREKVLSWWEQNYSGGPKVLLGGLPNLLEYLKDKYEVSRDLTPEQVAQLIEQSTEHWKEIEEEEAKNKGSGGNISIVGAGSNEAVSFLLYAIMTTKTPVIRSGIKIKLFEPHDDRQEQLKQNFDHMSTVESNINICIVEDLEDVFKNCDLLIFLGDKFRTTGMDIEKFLYLEKVLYGSYGFLCNYNMEEQTKVIFACMENAAFNATCFLAEAPTVDKKKVVALTSYLGTELKLYISKMAGFPVESLEQIPVWGMADTCHLVDVDMGSLIFRIPDSYNPKYPNIKSLARLIEDETLRVQLYKVWKMQQDKCVAQWRWSKMKENLKIEETKANIRCKRMNVLNSLADCYREAEKRYGRVPYWSIWDKLMAEVEEGEDYYSPENMYRRFRKGLYQVVQDDRYFENEAQKTTTKLEREYKKIAEKAETLADYVDPLNIGLIDSGAIKKFLEEEFIQQDLKMVEEDDADELCNETEIPEEVRDIEVLRREVYNKRNELKKKIRSYWKRHMEEEIARLEHELRRKSRLSKGEEFLEEEWMLEEDVNEVKSDIISSDTFGFKSLSLVNSLSPPTNAAPISDTVTRDNQKTLFYGGEETFEETTPPEIKLPEREVLNRMIKDYFKAKMKLERKIKHDLEKDSEPADSYHYEEIDDYEIRELGFITRSMRNLWNFIGICKNAVRKKIGQDPYIAQVHELIRVLKIWFFDPYMTSETIFLGIASDYDVYPFLSDTVMSQPAYCDENFRWHPLKEAEHLWPKTPFEKVPDNAETDVPFLRTPREGLPFTIQYVIGMSLECLMHFSIPPASYFETQRKVLDYADQKEFFDLVFTTRETDKSQLKDLFRRLGQEVESSVEDFVVDEEEEGEEEEEEESKFEAPFEDQFDFEGGEEFEEEIDADELGLEEFFQEENEPLKEAKPEIIEEVKQDSRSEELTEELNKLGTEEFEFNLEGEYEGDEYLIKNDFEEFKEEYDEDDPLNFLRAYGPNLTEEQFLAIFEKKRDPEKEKNRESEVKHPKRTKSLWKCYLQTIGFYNLDIPEIYIHVDDEVESNEDNYEKFESLEDEKPDNPFCSKSEEDKETPEEIAKEEISEEMSDEMLEEEHSQQKSEDHGYIMRGIGFIENIEHDFCPKNFTEMPFYGHFNMRVGVDINEKGIHEAHTAKVGFPIDAKGKSQMDVTKELMKMDIGKEIRHQNAASSASSVSRSELYLNQSARKDSFQVPFKRHNRKVSAAVMTKRMLSMIPTDVIKVHFPPNDVNTEAGSTDSYIPEDSVFSKSEETSVSKTTVSTVKEQEVELLELYQSENKRQEEILMNEKELLGPDYRISSVPQLQNIDHFEMELLKEPKISQQQKPKIDWVKELVEEFNSPMKNKMLDRGRCLSSVTSAYHFINEKLRMNAKNESQSFKILEKGSDYGENDEDEHYREAWLRGFEKLKRIMELEKISGNSYLHFELDKENGRFIAETNYEKERRFADWVGSVIYDHEKIQTLHSMDESLDGINPSAKKGPVNREQPESLYKNKDHHIWIKNMIKEIVIVDQICDLEKTIQSVKLFSTKNLSDEEFLRSVTTGSNRSSVRFSILENLGLTLKNSIGETDSLESLELSDEDIPKSEEQHFFGISPEQEKILREISKTEKEITKDCKDLTSYIQKCRDNTKLYCLYRGDTPQKWRFLSRQPNESKLRFKYKALIHMMLTMAKLQEEFHNEMEELQAQDMDFTKVLSDALSEEELKRYGFPPSGRAKPKPKAKTFPL